MGRTKGENGGFLVTVIGRGARQTSGQDWGKSICIVTSRPETPGRDNNDLLGFPLISVLYGINGGTIKAPTGAAHRGGSQRECAHCSGLPPYIPNPALLANGQRRTHRGIEDLVRQNGIKAMLCDSDGIGFLANLNIL